MASAREKFNTKGGGVPSLFAYTIKDTQKLGEHRFPSKNKYIKNDITISTGIESRDTDLEGFGDVIKKVKKEDVQVPAGAIRKHKMVKQISGRFNSEGKKKGFDIFALIDDAIEKDPTEEAKEKARERAAAKNAVHEPIPARVVRKKTKPIEPTPPTFQTPSENGETTTKKDEPVLDRDALDIADTPIHTPSVPAMFATTTTNSIQKREPAWKLRLQDKKPNAPTSRPVVTKNSSSSDDDVERTPTTKSAVKEMGLTTTKIAAQVVAPQQASSTAALLEYDDSPKEGSLQDKDGQITLSSEKTTRGDSLNSSSRSTVTKEIGSPEEANADLTGILPPVAVAVALAETPKDTVEDNVPPETVSKETDLSKGPTRSPVVDVVTSEIKPTQKEPAWKLRLQERQAQASGEIDATKGTNIDLVHSARPLAANVESPALKKEPAWKLRFQERQAAATIAEPVTPLDNVVPEKGVVFDGGKVNAPSNQLNDPPVEAPDDDDFSVSISSVESDQSNNEHILHSGNSHVSAPEQVVVPCSPKEPDSCSLQDMKSDLEISAPLSEISGGQLLDSFDEPKSHALQLIEHAVEKTATVYEKRNDELQAIGTAELLKEDSISRPLTSAKHSDDTPSNDSSRKDELQAIGTAASLKAKPISRPLTFANHSDDSESDDSSRSNGVRAIGTAASLKAERISRPLTLGAYSDNSESDVSDSSSDDDLPISRTLKRTSDVAPEVTKFLQTSKFAKGSTEARIPLSEKVDALLARKSPSVPQFVSASVAGSQSDKLEWLRAQIKDTETKIQATMVDAKRQVAELRMLFDEEMETMQEDFEERTRAQRRINLEQDKKHEKLLNEEKKIVESLRVENKTLRANVDRLPKQMAEMTQSIANLETANKEIETHTEGLLRFSKKLETDHDKLIESRKQCRDVYLPRYREELWERQMALDTEQRIKNLYRDCVIKIAKHVGESSKKPDLVEEINELVLETEAEVNPKFDPRVLVASDSDSSSSSDSDDSSDSDSTSD